MRRVISSVWMRRWCAFVRSGAARQRVAYAGNAQRLTNRADGMADRHLCDCVHAAVTGTVLSLIATGMRRAVEHKSARWPPAHALSLARKPSENADRKYHSTRNQFNSAQRHKQVALYTHLLAGALLGRRRRGSCAHNVTTSTDHVVVMLSCEGSMHIIEGMCVPGDSNTEWRLRAHLLRAPPRAP